MCILYSISLLLHRLDSTDLIKFFFWPRQYDYIFYVFNILLTVHPGMILVNNQLEAQFFMYVYFYSLHVSGSHVPIIRRIIVSMGLLVYVTLCR